MEDLEEVLAWKDSCLSESEMWQDSVWVCVSVCVRVCVSQSLLTTKKLAAASAGQTPADPLSK